MANRARKFRGSCTRRTRRPTLSLVPLLFSLGMLLAAQAGAAAADGAMDDWLMMVTTHNTDPRRSAEFNDWYDRIDIPDVLKVPGYMRARRGARQAADGRAVDDSNAQSEYVALYDIESRYIDKTIIDMLMASWGMEKAHHSTDLLKVTERVYFHRYPGTYRGRAAAAQSNQYLYTTRFDCCENAGSMKRFDRWYDTVYMPAVASAGGFVSAARYEVYRVLMDDPVEIPRYLAVFEIQADSAKGAADTMDGVADRLSKQGRMEKSYAAGSHAVFLKINDVLRQ